MRKLGSAGVAIVAACVGAGCSAKYATGPNGVPEGPPAVTYYGPGAGLGGAPVTVPPSPPPAASLPAEAIPPPKNLTPPGTTP
jgi:hypothetical protein